MGAETPPSPDIKTREAFIAEVVDRSVVLIHSHFNGWRNIVSNVPYSELNTWNFPDSDSKYFLRLRHLLNQTRADNIDRSKIFEVICFVPVIKPLYGKREITVSETGLKGMLKMTKKVSETFVRGYGFLDLKTFTNQGNDEDVVWVGYLGQEFNNELVRKTEPIYKDRFERTGNCLYFNLAMPKQLAEELYLRLKQDPDMIRDIMELAITSKSFSFLREEKSVKEIWKETVRPPFEKWKKYGSGILIYNYPFDSIVGRLKPDVSLVPYTTTQ